MNFSRRLLILIALSLCGFASAVSAGPAPSTGTFTYRRVFKSSTPEFIEIKIPQGADTATYEIRQLDEDAGASPLPISSPLRAKIMELVGQLGYFQGLDLDVHRKIANLGEKTFRWQTGSKTSEVVFNYTLNMQATQLVQICEGLARQQELMELLQRRIKYDRLGVNDALLQFETDFNRGVLPEPQVALPLLEQIADDSHVVEIARQRARSLAERVRHPA
jgi:hypothetical protein